MMLPVRDAKPWPDQQRYDYLVRSRELSPEMAAAAAVSGCLVDVRELV